MGLIDNPFLEVFIPLAIGLYLPISYFNVTFLTIAQAPWLIILLYVGFLLLLLAVGYRIIPTFGPIAYGATGYWFILHQTMLDNGTPDYGKAILYLAVFIVIALVVDRVRMTFWLALLGALTGVYIAKFLGVQNLSALAALVGCALSTVVSQSKRFSEVTERGFNYVAAIVAAGAATVLLWMLIKSLMPNIAFLNILEFAVFGVAVLFQIRLIHSKKEKAEPSEEPNKKQRLDYALKGMSLVFQVFVVVYLTLNIGAVRNSFFLPLPPSIQQFMDNYSNYTGYIADPGSPNTLAYYYADLQSGSDVLACPHLACPVIAHYPPNLRLERIMLVHGDSVNGKTDWVEVLDRGQLGYVSVAYTTTATYSVPVKSTPHP
jgi:hypothetical protein